MRAANEDEFQGQREIDNRLRAMGTKADSMTRLGGIANPNKMKLSPGDIIFRFGNRARAEADDRAGAWWITQATLMLNAQYASSIDALLRTLRQNLAVPPAFSALDRLFGASLRLRLTAFAGIGAGIFGNDLSPTQRVGAPPLLLGGMETDGSARGVSLRFQLFIPGLVDCAEAALAYGRPCTLAEWFAKPDAKRQFP